MKKFNSFEALAAEVNRERAIAADAAKAEAKKQAEMDAMYAAREAKLAIDKHAQINYAWHLYR